MSKDGARGTGGGDWAISTSSTPTPSTPPAAANSAGEVASATLNLLCVIGLINVRNCAWHPCSTSAHIFTYWLLFREVVTMIIAGTLAREEEETEEEDETLDRDPERKGLGRGKLGVLGVETRGVWGV